MDAVGNGHGNGTHTKASTQSTNTSPNASSSWEHNDKSETTKLIERKAEYGMAYIVYTHFVWRKVSRHLEQCLGGTGHGFSKQISVPLAGHERSKTKEDGHWKLLMRS